MIKIEGQQFEGSRILVDGYEFVSCSFRECEFVVAATGAFSLKHCEIWGPQFDFVSDAAAAWEALDFLFDSRHGSTFIPIIEYVEGKGEQREIFAVLKGLPGADYMRTSSFVWTLTALRELHAMGDEFNSKKTAQGWRASLDKNALEETRTSAASQKFDELYVYLPEPWMATAWCDGGGPVPVQLASTYFNATRTAQFTPDETVTVQTNIPLEDVPPEYGMLGLAPATMFSGFENCVDGNVNPLPDFLIEDLSRYDGLVMCFARSRSNFIARKFGRTTCVKVLDFAALKESLDQQIGSVSEFGDCAYTAGHRRACFQKSAADAWQHEFRLYWPKARQKVNVLLPEGCGAIVEVDPEQAAFPHETQRLAAIIANSILDIAANPPRKRPVPTMF